MHPVFKFLPLLATVAIACTPEVIVQGQPSDPETPTTSAGGSDGSGGAGAGGQASAIYDALAFGTGDPGGTTVSVGQSSGGSTSVVTSTGGSSEGLQIVLGEPIDASVCAPPPSVSCGQWQVELRIPDPLLQVGLVMSLEDANGFSTASGQNEGAPAGDCWWGGGSFWDGEIEILAITDDAVEFELRNTFDFDFDADGVYVARRCD